MVTFTSSISEDLYKLLSEKAGSLKMHKNKIIENALRLYLEYLERAEYIKSYKQAVDDADILQMAEEGMCDYLKQLEQ